MIIKPTLLKKLTLIKIFKNNECGDIKRCFGIISCKKKFDKIFINANAGTPNPKNFKAAAVISTSLTEKDPYPNNAFTISFEAIINPKLAGKEKEVKVQMTCFGYQIFF